MAGKHAQALILGVVLLTLPGCAELLGADGYRTGEPGPDNPCGALEVPDAHGGCATVGVPEGDCARGFESDDLGGCRPILPTSSCESRPEDATSLVAGLGARQCLSLGSGCYAGYPVLGSAAPNPRFYVRSDAPEGGDGTEASPVRTIMEAVRLAGAGAATVSVYPGTYEEAVEIKAPIGLRGGCFDTTTVRPPPGSRTPAIHIVGPGATDAAISNLRVAGQGIVIDGAERTLIGSARIDATDGPGLVVQDDLGPASVSLYSVLIDHATGAGVEVHGGRLDATGVLYVRDTQPLADGSMGYGIAVRPGALAARPEAAAQGELVLEGAVLSRNHGAGIFIEGSKATVRRSVVQDTLPNGLGEGRGVVVQRRPLGPVSASLILEDTVVERSHDVAVMVVDSPAPLDGSPGVTAALDRVTLRGVGLERVTAPGARCAGTGLRVRSDGFFSEDGEPPVTLRNSLVDGALDTGVLALGAHVGVTGSIIRDVRGCGGDFGDGIASLGDARMASHVVVSGSRVVGSARAGIAAFGARVEAPHTLIEDAGDVPIASVVRGGQEATIAPEDCLSVTRGSLSRCSVKELTLAPPIRGGNGCDAFPDGSCFDLCWDDLVSRFNAVDRTTVVFGNDRQVMWAPDDLTLASAIADAGGCTEWGGLPTGTEIVMALGRDRDAGTPERGFLPIAFWESVGSGSLGKRIFVTLDSLVAWSAFSNVASIDGTKLDARVSPWVGVVLLQPVDEVPAPSEPMTGRGFAGARVVPVAGSDGPAYYVSEGGALSTSDGQTGTSTLFSAGSFMNVSAGELTARVESPPDSALSCRPCSLGTGWRNDRQDRPGTFRVLARPGYIGVGLVECTSAPL